MQAPLFQHQHTAHCESGVMSTLLRHHGIDWDEAMVFGMAAALTFAYIPLVKLGGQPLVAYRMPPKSIIRRSCRQLGVRLHMRRFRSEEAGMAALDAALARGELVGLQTSVFWLPYFPEAMRFHFNAHNLLVYGKEGDDYLISDPVFETVQRCAAADLRRARFAKGALAAKGLMYTLDTASLPDVATLDLRPLLRRALLQSVRQMQAPLFFIGVRGIRTVADKLAALDHSGDAEAQKQWLGHLVRMQEEIGTGGAGFRYLYAYFLEQAGEALAHPSLLQAAQTLTDIGDDWRQFASLCVRQCRKPDAAGPAALAAALRAVADCEAALWQDIRRLAKAL